MYQEPTNILMLPARWERLSGNNGSVLSHSETCLRVQHLNLTADEAGRYWPIWRSHLFLGVSWLELTRIRRHHYHLTAPRSKGYRKRQTVVNKLLTNSLQEDFRISFGSNIQYLDLIQELALSITKLIGIEEDLSYWIGLSVRESVTNAIRHGNKQDETKKVGLRFKISPDRLMILVQDEGKGFDISSLPDPLDQDNLLKPSGRGIFYVRTFMDDVRFRNRPEGGFEVRMEKRLDNLKGEKDED